MGTSSQQTLIRRVNDTKEFGERDEAEVFKTGYARTMPNSLSRQCCAGESCRGAKTGSAETGPRVPGKATTVVIPNFFSSARPCAEGCAPRKSTSLIFPARGTPASFNFSAGAPKEARAIADCAGALATTCACEGQAAAAMKHAAKKVLHKLKKTERLTMSSMP